MRLLRMLLFLPFSLLYGLAVAIRNVLFDVGLLPRGSVRVPVISVGNVSVGGTGKTPMVEWIVRSLQQQGRRVAVLSRGYRRATSGYVVVSNGRQRCAEIWDSGDEPAQLADTLEYAVVAVDEDRVRGANSLVRDFDVDVIVLDDGFQHRYLRRNLDIVMLPVDELLSPGLLLPAGRLREPLSSLRRADLLVVSRCESTELFFAVKSELRWIAEKPIAAMRLVPVRLRHLVTGEQHALSALQGARIVAVSGIGHPDGFEKTLKELSVEIVRHMRFPDHHPFTSDEWRRVEVARHEESASFILTTAKDAARLRGVPEVIETVLKDLPVYELEIKAEIVEGRELFEAFLKKF